MVNEDTMDLLKECHSEIKTAAGTIEDVLPKIQNEQLRTLLTDSKRNHELLGGETGSLLCEYGGDFKETGSLSKGMSWVKKNIMLTVSESDSVISDLITDGCSEGIKSIKRNLNKYSLADEKVKGIAERLIYTEQSLSDGVGRYL
ncbi:MAG: hypothetical protein Q8873_07065 [Bacillota bacterium]|nr:hypothetical protein [Bacillota bacterium]